MLYITIPASEKWDGKNNIFITTKECTLQLEHSLVSLHKWESKWKKPFLSDAEKTREETIDYIKCMSINPAPQEVYDNIAEKELNKINNYISDPMTASWFSDDTNKVGKKSSEVITAEIIYYWMVALNIPFECKKWHLNQLLALVKTCNLKNQPAKKMSKKDVLKRNAELNAKRRAQVNSTG